MSGRITIGKAKPGEAHKDYWVVRKGGKKVSAHMSKSAAKEQAEAMRRVKIKRAARLSKMKEPTQYFSKTKKKWINLSNEDKINISQLKKAGYRLR